MIMAGNNKLTLCPEALRCIVQRHLRSTQAKTDDPRIHVRSVAFLGGDLVCLITTDEPVKQITATPGSPGVA